MSDIFDCGDVRAPDAAIEIFRERIAVLETSLRRTSADATRVAEEAIGLFLEYRDGHGCDEEAATRGAMREVSEGLQAADEIAPYQAHACIEGISASLYSWLAPA